MRRNLYTPRQLTPRAVLDKRCQEQHDAKKRITNTTRPIPILYSLESNGDESFERNLPVQGSFSLLSLTRDH
jgi:hypothetical protein